MKIALKDLELQIHEERVFKIEERQSSKVAK
jgi:hypothetical protein